MTLWKCSDKVVVFFRICNPNQKEHKRSSLLIKKNKNVAHFLE